MTFELVTTLKRHATQIIRELNRKHEPIFITEHCKPAAYLVDVRSYGGITQRMELLEGLARGEAAIEGGRVVSHEEAKKRLGRWLR